MFVMLCVVLLLSFYVVFNDTATTEIYTYLHTLSLPRRSSDLIIVNGREHALQRVMQRGCWSESERFGTSDDSGWQIATHDDDSFDVLLQGDRKSTRLNSSH